MPRKPSVAQTFIKTAGPECDVLADKTLDAIPPANVLGVNYAKISEDVWTAINAAISGSASVQSALNIAASQVGTIVKG